MRSYRYVSIGIALVLALSLFTQGSGGASAHHQAAIKLLKGQIIIGQITSLTGAYSIYGTMQTQGFHAGLAYATNGTFRVDKAVIIVKQYNDTPANAVLPDAPTAVADAKQAITSDGAQILQCCAFSPSAIAVAGVAKDNKKILMVAPAADDSLTGINRYTFRTSRMNQQDARTGAVYFEKKFGKNYMALAQDYTFGHGQVADWKTFLDKVGANDMGDVYFPLTATDFTPYIQQILDKKPQWVFMACAGAQCVALAKALDASGVLDRTKVVTGLANVATLPAYGPAGTKLGFISVYYYKFPKTKANDFLKKYIQQHYNRPADIFDQDSFAAAQQIVAALKKTHSTSAAKLIPALEGQTVAGPKGDYTIRKQDHAALQPMYIAQLTYNGTTFDAKLVHTFTPKQVAPTIQAHSWK
jgi:branched-chain amino acid transport system substrate-binding protein